MYLFLVGGSSEHEKANRVNRNIVATITDGEYKHLLLNNKCLRHSMNRIQSKTHTIGTYKINKFSLLCFDDKTYIKTMDMMDQILVIRINFLKKTVTLITIQNSFFVKLQKYCFNFLSSQSSFLSSNKNNLSFSSTQNSSFTIVF